jgi:acyl dehydratase
MSAFRHFEDFTEGEIIPFQPRVVTREEIIAFAAEFDPQPMHLDEEAASRTPLGGLAASGWHTCALFMRMMCESFLLHSSSWGSPGVDELTWHRPVRPGDRLAGRAIVLATRASSSRPEMGIVTFRFEIENAAGDLMMSAVNPILFGRRTPVAGADE